MTELGIDAKRLTSSIREQGPEVRYSLPMGLRAQAALQRALEMLHRSPGCYLITGYRGVGKTYFIEQVTHP